RGTTTCLSFSSTLRIKEPRTLPEIRAHCHARAWRQPFLRFPFLYFAYINNANKYTHTSAMKCQYQTVTSITIRRDSTGRFNREVVCAHNSAINPPARCTACVIVSKKANELLGFVST